MGREQNAKQSFYLENSVLPRVGAGEHTADWHVCLSLQCEAFTSAKTGKQSTERDWLHNLKELGAAMFGCKCTSSVFPTSWFRSTGEASGDRGWKTESCCTLRVD